MSSTTRPHNTPSNAGPRKAVPALPDRSLAALRHEYGPPAGIVIAPQLVPTPGPGQVLLQVHAGGLDRGAWHLMAGEPYAVRLAGYGVRRPKQPRLGLDVAGTVVALGKGVDTFAVGDEVFGIADGSWAEHAVADATRLALRPPNVSPVQAAVSAVSGITALQALVDVAGVDAGRRVLVVGASGGVGSFAVQLAVALGATVDGVASAAKAELVRDLGASHVYDYATEDPYDGSQRYDVIIDTGGCNPVRILRRALTERGTLVIVGGEDGGSITGGVGRQMRAAMLSPFVRHRMAMFISAEAKGHVAKLAAYLEDGSIVPAVGATYQLADVRIAIEDLLAGRARGKSAILVAPSQDEVTS